MLLSGLRRTNKQISSVIKRLKELRTGSAIERADYVKIEDLFVNNEVLGHQWREFSECVVMESRSDGSVQYRNTVGASEFFNFEDVVNTSDAWRYNVKFNFFNVVPNLLTGFGILGTFIGIVKGLPSHGEIDVDQFVNGVKMSFGTSICGLLSATIFTFVEKFNVDRTEHVVSELAQEIDRLFRRKVEQEYLINIANHLEQQNTTLKTLATEIGGEIVKSITGGGIDTVKIGDGVKEGIKEGFEKLGANLEQLNELHGTYQDSARLILDESKGVGIAVSYLNKAVQGYSGNVEDTSKRFENMGIKLEELSNKQSTQMEQISNTSENIVKASQISQESIDKLVSTKDDFQKSFSQTSDSLEKMVSSFSGLVEDYNTKTQGAMNETFKSFDDELSKAVSSLGKGIGEMAEGVDNMAYYLAQLKQFSDQALKELEESKEASPDIPPPIES